MENLDLTVLRALRDWRAAGQHALMATVVRTWGSSPRPVGSIMALAERGAVSGSVSGGCIEDDLIARYTRAAAADALHASPDGAPQFVKYGISADEAHRFGLPCGGTLELLLEFDPDVAALDDLVHALEAGGLMQRSVSLANGQVRLTATDTPAALSRSATELTNTFGPEYRMLIIGAGQMSEYLATMAQFSGQTKERLSSRQAAGFIEGAAHDAFSLWLNQHTDFGERIAQLAIERASARLKTEKQIVRKKVTQGPALPGKLADCISQDLSRTTVSPVPTRLSARVVGTPRWCIASLHRNSRSEERSTARPSAKRE